MASARVAGRDYLLMTELPGVNGGAPELTSHPGELVDGMAAVLRRVHATPATDCPFDARTPALLELAAARVSQLRAEDFPGRYGSRLPRDLYRELVRMVPDTADEVFTHGRRISSVMTHQPVHHPRLTSESKPVGEPHDAAGVTP